MKKCIALISFLLFAVLSTEAQPKNTATDRPGSAQQPKKEVFEFVEQEPEFPQGEDSMMSFIAHQVSYPEIAIMRNVEGKVILNFVIDDEGNVIDVHEMRSNFIVPPKEKDADLSVQKKALVDEAIRVVRSMPKWKPGKQNGKAVNCKFTLPIQFVLN